MPHVCITGLVWKVRGKSVFWWYMVVQRWCAHLIVIIIVQITPAVEVGRTFMFVSGAILDQRQLLRFLRTIVDARIGSARWSH